MVFLGALVCFCPVEGTVFVSQSFQHYIFFRGLLVDGLMVSRMINCDYVALVRFSFRNAVQKVAGSSLEMQCRRGQALPKQRPRCVVLILTRARSLHLRVSFSRLEKTVDISHRVLL